MKTHKLDSKAGNSDIRAKRIGRLASLATVAIALATSATAGAEERWVWTVEPYLWATDVGMNVSISDKEIVDETIPFEDLLDDLERVFQIRVEARHNKHGISLDLFDVVLADSGDRVTLPGGSGNELVMDTEIGLTILDFSAIYNVSGNGDGLSLLYGTRIINQRNDVTAERQNGDVVLSTIRVDANDTLVDAMVGVRYKHQIGHWSYQLSADISAGDTDLSWSINPTVSYGLGTDHRNELVFGFKRLVIDFDTGNSMDMDMTMSGPMIGWRFQF